MREGPAVAVKVDPRKRPKAARKMNVPTNILTSILITTYIGSLILSCNTREKPERRAIKQVIATLQTDIPENDYDYTVVKNPEGLGWIVTIVSPFRSNLFTAKYLVRGDKVYAINGWAMTWSPGIPNVRDERITDCPGGYTPLKTPNEQEKEALSEIPLEKRKEIYYEFIKYQDEHPGKAKESYGIIADRYGITKEMLNLIMSEGFEERWPEPAYPD